MRTVASIREASGLTVVSFRSLNIYKLYDTCSRDIHMETRRGVIWQQTATLWRDVCAFLEIIGFVLSCYSMEILLAVWVQFFKRKNYGDVSWIPSYCASCQITLCVWVGGIHDCD